jgi:hypothetical protein
MAHHMTIKELIKDLQSYENQDQPIIFTYYLAEHCVDQATDDTMTPERFEKVADRVNDCDHFWDDVWESVVEAVVEIDLPEEEWSW